MRPETVEASRIIVALTHRARMLTRNRLTAEMFEQAMLVRHLRVIDEMEAT